VYKTAHLFNQKLSAVGENLSKNRLFFRLLAIGLGALHVYAAIKSQSMNADGISYLDIGDAYFHADWANAINPVWSPLYSWVLGFANFVVRPSMQWEFPVVHLVNFLIYLIALSSFEFMWKNVRTYENSSEWYAMPDSWWWTLGYLLFIWISLSLIQLWSITPDMLMAGLVFLAAGLLAKIRVGDDKHRIFLGLGLILGLGYLSKTFMLSVALVFLALAWLVQKPSLNSLFKTLFAVGAFLLISLPFILLISNVKGRLTIGEAGTVTFLRYVNGMPFPHWQGDPDRGIIPTHPSRVIHESPAVYEFGEPIGGTYPISLDPSYWYEGIEPRFDFRGLLARLLSSSLVYAELFFQKQGILLACVLTMYVMGQRRGHPFREILRRWALTIPAVIAFGLYGMVLVEGRYVGVFILLFWADILANVRLPDTVNTQSWLNVLSGIAAFGLVANIAMFNLDGFKRLNPTLGVSSVPQVAPPAKPLEVAQTLKELGVQPGDKVGVIGYAYDSFWARLARLKIAAEMLESDATEFWRGNEALRQGVLQSFAKASVKAVVAEYVPEDVMLTGWHRVDETNFYIYILDSNQ
jgi:hypothetical protein